MGTVTAIQQFEQIRRELRELDLKNSLCPVDRRRAEKDAEEQARKPREAKEQQQTTNWMRWIDQRIAAWFKNYFDGEDGPQFEDGHRHGHYTAALGRVIAEQRKGRRKEVKDAIEEERQSVDAKLEALEQASNDRWAVIDQRIDRARESVLQGTGEVLEQFCAELKEFKPTLEEKERAFEAKLAELEARLKSVPGKRPVVKTCNRKPSSIRLRWFHTTARCRRNGIPRKSPEAQTGFASRGMVAMRSRRSCAVPTMSMTATRRWTSSALTAVRTLPAATIRVCVPAMAGSR
jgi:hypothetical protein